MSPKVLFYFSNDSAGACGDSPGLLFGKFAVHFPGAGDFAGPDFHPSRTQYFTDRTDGTPALPCEDVERPGRRTGSDDECTFAFLPGLRKAESRFAHENRNEPFEEHLQPGRHTAPVGRSPHHEQIGLPDLFADGMGRIAGQRTDVRRAALHTARAGTEFHPVSVDPFDVGSGLPQGVGGGAERLDDNSLRTGRSVEDKCFHGAVGFLPAPIVTLLR